MIRLPSLLLPIAILLGASLNTGCANTATDTVAAPPEPSTPDTSVPVQRSYDSEVLADLLVAEVAAQHRAYSVAHGYYQHAALLTRDPDVVSQATRIAYFLDDPSTALALSQLWRELQPEEEAALRIAILAQIELGQTDAASADLDHLLEHFGSPALGRLVAQTRGLDEQGNLQLIDALSRLAERHPKQGPLWYARALWLEHQGELRLALDADTKALRLLDFHEDAVLHKSKIHIALGETDSAIRLLKKYIRRHPDNRRLRLSLARTLLATGQVDDAEAQLQALAERYPNDLDLRFSLALLALDAQAFGPAEAQLQTLLDAHYRVSEVHLYLAQAAEQQDHLEAAIEHYLAVTGSQQLRAWVQAARLQLQAGDAEGSHQTLSELRTLFPEMTTSLTISEAGMLNDNGLTEQAIERLNGALSEQPDDHELRYSRAMIAESRGDLALLESDLQYILARDPNDATALNALGYTLANRTERHDEALDYIQQALALKPDDPAILDSMGWVLYKLGQPADALPYLQRAYTQFPDPEVAAHYGEVLWVLGEQKQARTVWQDALAQSPDNAFILETLEKLGVRL